MQIHFDIQNQLEKYSQLSLIKLPLASFAILIIEDKKWEEKNQLLSCFYYRYSF